MLQIFAFVSLSAIILVADSRGEDKFFAIPLTELKIVEGKLPDATAHFANGGASDWLSSATLDGDGEAYVGAQGNNAQNWPTTLLVRAGGNVVNGRLFLATENASKFTGIKFTLPESPKPAKREEFFQAKAEHYERLLNHEIPGAAWFRHQAREARAQSGTPMKDNLAVNSFVSSGGDDIGLFTGGRAVSENLALSRGLTATTQQSEANIDVNSISGIDIAAIDWKPLIKDLHPQTDPLASCIPENQYAIFFPSIKPAMAMLALAETNMTPVLQTFEPRAESAQTRQRYERQLGITLEELTKIADGAVAVTGSDPYVRVGGDVAILLETKESSALVKQLTQIAEKNIAASGIKAERNDTEGGVSFASPDRSISSFIATLGNEAVVITNSTEQLNHVRSTQRGTSPSLAMVSEYTFFRDRYRRGEGGESALLILSDATIRRWCSARWRIADMRRTRAAAVLSELQAENLAALATGKAEIKPLTDPFHAGLGEIKLTPTGVFSSTYNTVAFMTPISELDLKLVTKEEKEAYLTWRRNYERNWRWAFDPIALRISTNDQKIAADLTVMPLIANSEYRQFIGLTQGAAIAPDAGDPHNAIAHLAMSINPQSGIMRSAAMVLSGFTPGVKVDPFAWMGSSLALYADEDPFWDEMAKAEDPEEFLENNYQRVPVALRAEVKDTLKLVGFIAAGRAYLEQSAPGMTLFEPQKYNDLAYVKVTATEQGRKDLGKEMENMAIFYSASSDGFIITPSESAMKRALDRQKLRRAATQPGAAKLPATQPWLGENVALQIDGKFLDIFRTAMHEEYQNMVQDLAWKNLPILNEYRRMFPVQDPIALHERLWTTKLLDPAGGTYAWNEKWQTYESSVYGHPGEPKKGSADPEFFHNFRAGNFGLTFENKGLRAKAEIQVMPPGK